jgi:ATP-dependent DNA ligase
MSKFEALALQPPIEPMEARSAARLPEGPEWTYEPKWDGFRCVIFRCDGEIELQSKSGQTLTRYFPEIVAAIGALQTVRFVLDGEIFIEGATGLDFDALLQRIHPAASRVQMLSRQTPSTFAAFDLLIDGVERWWERPLSQRRNALETFARRCMTGKRIVLSPATEDPQLARAWLTGDVARLDGVIAKRADAPYAFGRGDAVVKLKRSYTADCVIGGFRTSPDGTIASLLLGLYDNGKLDHVGFVGSMSAAQRAEAGDRLRPIVEPPGFTGNAPGGPSRWRKGEAPWSPVKPSVVVEVAFDHVTARRFRHAARLLRWRPDKSPERCTIDQLLDPR